MATRNKKQQKPAATSSASIDRIVIEVLGERRKRLGRRTGSLKVRSQEQLDREKCRQAISVLLRKPKADVTDALLDEIIGNIEAEAAADADSVAANLTQLVAHLQSLKCSTRHAVFEYFAAAERVLLELYGELRQPRPSPTRLRQLTVQYALDPRKRIDAAAHQIEIRNRDDGYEIAVAPPGTSHLPSIPLPGIVVKDHFSALFLSLLLSDPPCYSAFMQRIEMLLEYVPAEKQTFSNSPPVTPATAVQVDIDDSVIILFGRRYVADVQQIRFLQPLLEKPGIWVSSKGIKEDPLFAGVRIDRVCSKLPPAIQEFIESGSGTGKGYRLRLELLEESCQNSSVDL